MTRPAVRRDLGDALDSPPRQPPGGRASTFDVPSWLAGLVNCPADEVRYVSEAERNGRRTVTYQCNGKTARVRMAPVAGAAAWELEAEAHGTADRVVLPAGTRFVWRPAGSHS